MCIAYDFHNPITIACRQLQYAAYNVHVCTDACPAFILWNADHHSLIALFKRYK